MADDEKMLYPGEVLEILPNGHYKVKVKELDFVMQAYKWGKMKKYHINLLPGDRVDVEINQYDISKWRITYRHRWNPYTNGSNWATWRPPTDKPRKNNGSRKR